MAQVILIIPHSVTVRRVVAIPRRQINAEPNAGVLGGGSEVADDVAVAVPPFGGKYRVVSVVRGPQAETVVVLRGKDHAREATFFGNSYPLSGIELCGVEGGGVGVAGTPFRSGEGVDAEMEEHGHVAELPLELECVGEWQNGKWRWREVLWWRRCSDQGMTQI